MKVKFLKASKGDCFLISFEDEMKVLRNILIDGGVKETYFDSSNNLDGDLKLEIDRLKKNNEKIDLLILSHIDNDHILGLLKWFEMDRNAFEFIGNTLFNSGKLIAEYLKEPENPDLELGLNVFNTTYTGVNQAIDFEKYLLEHKIWNRKVVCAGNELDENGINIKILSPTKEQLLKLLKEYKNITKDNSYTGSSTKDWKNSLKDLINDEKSNYKKPRDNSPKNQSSISFILTINNRKFLFLADAPSEQIVKELHSLGYNKENPLKIEFMKVSHHGSKNNTSNEILQIIKTNHYLISTDSSCHGHPDKRTLARILRYNPNATFHFNYNNVKNGVISKNDFKNFKNLKSFVTKEFDYCDE